MKNLNPLEFIALCRFLLGDKKIYKDTVIQIRKDYNGLELEITGNGKDEGGILEVSNPVIMISDDNILIRVHGQYTYLIDHVCELVGNKLK